MLNIRVWWRSSTGALSFNSRWTSLLSIAFGSPLANEEVSVKCKRAASNSAGCIWPGMAECEASSAW